MATHLCLLLLVGASPIFKLPKWKISISSEAAEEEGEKNIREQDVLGMMHLLQKVRFLLGLQ